MARRKTVSISPKPSTTLAFAGDAVALEPESPVEAIAESKEIGASVNPIARAVYGAAFSVSYGVVFTAILLGHLVPGRRLIGRGLCDGAKAAQRTFNNS